MVWRLDVNHETETQGQFHGNASVAGTLVTPARTSLCPLGLFIGSHSVRFMLHYKQRLSMVSVNFLGLQEELSFKGKEPTSMPPAGG